MKYVTITELSSIIRTNLWKIPHDIDLVVGIPRSGMLPANIIALFLNANLSDLDTFIKGGIYQIGNTRKYMMKHQFIKKVLIIDDSVYSGKTMEEAKSKLGQLEDKYEFTFMAPIVTSIGKSFVDIYFTIINEKRIFEWNLFHHILLEKACLDFDGILCCDPEEDDDGPKYMNFLKTAKPLFIPTCKIGTIISCRLEKYREQTQEWLSKYNIIYENLILLNLSSKKERIAWGRHGEYKGEYFKSNNYELFIESSLMQAETIAKLSHKYVICLENNSLIFYPPSTTTVSKRIKAKIKTIISIMRNIIKI